jgi:hypothetical protein
MATVAELRAEKARLEAEEQKLRSEYDRFGVEISRLIDEQGPLSSELRAQRAIITDPNATQAQKDAAVQRGVEIENQIRSSDAQIRNVRDQQNNFLEQQLRPIQNRLFGPFGINSEIQRAETAERAQADQGPKTVSAGALQTEAETARDDQALSQNPPPARPDVIDQEGRITEQSLTRVPSNAQPADTTAAQEAAVEGALSISPAPPKADPSVTSDGTTRPADGYSRNANGSLSISITGVGQIPQDDNIAVNPTQAEITQRFQEPLVPRPNILDQYASYTYSISIYLMSGERYAALLTDRRKSVDGMQLLIQSGGADTASRNEFFDLDFYIDNLSLTSYIQGKATRAAHNVTELSFRIIEPNGITLLSRLYRAVQKYAGGDPGINKNYAAQHYLMVIRFYGYDAQGKRVTPSTQDPQGTTDRQAIVEKFIPFRFTDIKFTVGNRLTEYQCRAVAPQNDLNTGRARGILPFAVQVQGGTLEGLLSGPASSTATAAQAGSPSKAGSAASRTYTSGLEQALNQFQASFVTQENPIFDVADRYFFRILDNSLRNAQVRPPGSADLGRTAQPKPATAADSKDGTKQSVATNTKFVSGYPGQSIVQFLDLLIRNSTFIYDQEVVVETTEEGKKVQRAASTPAWYHIGLEARPRKQDPRRGDYAYDFIYTINIYKINELVSDYFPRGRFSGSHKAYEYWFTGQNTQVLNFEQEFNYLYYLTVNTAQTAPTGVGRLQEVYKKAFAAQSPESKQGGSDNTGEPGANAADFLYSPGDLARAKLTIVGDPDWIQQGSLWAGAEDVSVTDSKFVNFVSDGSMNFDTQEILFSLAWNQPADYDLGTGLIPIKRAQ